MVAKSDPRLGFRAALDATIALAVWLQIELAEPWQPWLADIRSRLGNIMRADAVGEPLAAQSIVGLNEDELHRLSHQPLRYLDHDHLVPEAGHGRDAALLNLLRSKIRETETVAAQVFITRSFEVLRPDILQALNRLSSTVYVMMILSVAKHPLTVSQIQQRSGRGAMIIQRARQLALRSPARVVFADALDIRVLKAAHYLQQQGLAKPILIASPFALRQFALSHRLPMDGMQIVDPHSNRQMREAFAPALACPRRRKNAAGRGGKTQRPADVRRRHGQRREGRRVYCRQSLLDGERAARRITHYWPSAWLQNAVVDLSDAAAVRRTGAGICRLQRGAAADGGAAGGYRHCQRGDMAGHYRRGAAGGDAVVFQQRQRPSSQRRQRTAGHRDRASARSAADGDGELQFDAAFVPEVAAQKRPPVRCRGGPT